MLKDFRPCARFLAVGAFSAVVSCRFRVLVQPNLSLKLSSLPSFFLLTPYVFSCNCVQRQAPNCGASTALRKQSWYRIHYKTFRRVKHPLPENLILQKLRSQPGASIVFSCAARHRSASTQAEVVYTMRPGDQNHLQGTRCDAHRFDHV